jgi:hypothetical protein
MRLYCLRGHEIDMPAQDDDASPQLEFIDYRTASDVVVIRALGMFGATLDTLT